MSRIFLVAGEISGDAHGARLVTALKQHAPEIRLEGIGGPKMEQAGMELHHDLASQGIMGYVEVIKSLGLIRRLFNETLDRFRRTPPDVLVLIDYPGFNLRLAKKAHEMGIKVVYYISPQVWAWKKGRIHTLNQCVDKMLVILPFEKQIYDEVGLDCTFVGHPLLESISEKPIKGTFSQHEMLIGLLPGSRELEIRLLMPVMLDLAEEIRKDYPHAHFVSPAVDDERARQIQQLAGSFPLEIVQDEFYEILSAARFVLVASGTATVEATLFEVPMAVLYKMNRINYWLARLLVDIDAISLVNILAQKHIVPEFIQNEASVENILPIAKTLIAETEERKTMIQSLGNMKQQLGSTRASETAAIEILSLAETAHGE
jgi:lipid-A-disaccharide synthase